MTSEGSSSAADPAPPAAGPGSSRPLLFLARFLRNPRTVGAIAPSSRYLARKMVDVIPLAEGEQVVEFGPGTGAFTGEVLGRLPSRASYLGIELDERFVRQLQARFPSARFTCDSVARLRDIAREHEIEAVDHVISGLPFASLPEEVTREVLEALADVLRPGGTFTTFQYLHAHTLAPAKAFRERMEGIFGPSRRRLVEVRNLPPARVYSWQKP